MTHFVGGRLEQLVRQRLDGLVPAATWSARFGVGIGLSALEENVVAAQLQIEVVVVFIQNVLLRQVKGLHEKQLELALFAAPGRAANPGRRAPPIDGGNSSRHVLPF